MAARLERTERDESCFSRAARAIRRALSRICGDVSHSSPVSPRRHTQPETRSRLSSVTQDEELYESLGSHTESLSHVSPQSDKDDGERYSHLQRVKYKGRPFFSSDTSSIQDHGLLCPGSFSALGGPPFNIPHSVGAPRSSLAKASEPWPSFRSKRKRKIDSLIKTPVTDSPDYMLDRPLADLLREKGGIKTHSSAAGSTSGLDSTSPDNPREMELNTTASPSILQLSTSDDDDSDSDALCLREKEGDESSDRFCVPTSSQSTAPTVAAAPPCPRDRPTVLQDSTVSTEGSRTQDAFELLCVSEREPGADRDALMEIDAAVTAMKHSVTTTLPAQSQLLQSPECFRSRRDSGCLPRSHSLPSLSQITSEETQTFTRAESVPDVLLTNSFEEFTPEIRADENDESYWFQCSCPGLYQCRVTGLLFDMEAAGDVVYGIVPWNRRLLAQHHKKPAGPLFDIECLQQQSVRQLHVPHCEIRSTGGCDFLSVAHVNDEGVEFISPHKITETHVIINITGFSAFGNVKDEDSPPVPVRALVLLFYRPPADPDPTSLLNVLLLPRNVALRDVLRTRKKLVGDEMRATSRPPSVSGKDEFCLSSTGVRRSCGQSAVNLPPHEKLLDGRSSFIDGISGPVLKSLLDKLLEKKVMSDPERESADVMPNTRDKARFVIDTVRKKGEAASSEMIEFLCEADPFLCEHLGFI
ncbi:uncharacterized protein LOC121960956 [Plectropomus leopardus]|uniref:uncharacterized protein LOC121960956 n=1 Tax=Plectropomus leopardus TaxID=160734 RepID=UPI001C4AEFBF|nr:uncharacterized protein LOC121960956 [Plectropomus leopardus]